MSLTSIEITGAEQVAAWERRTLPPVERLAAGLWSVPVPIPDNPLRYTLSYLVPGDHGLVVVDPGWDTDEGWDALTAGLTAAGATVGDVEGVVATHVHPDHHGLSERVREKSGAWVAMHPAERASLPQRAASAASAAGSASASASASADSDHSGVGDRRAGFRRWLERIGAPADEIAELMPLFTGTGISAMAEPDVLLEDGDQVPMTGRRLTAIWTPGHTPGHLCLQEPDARLLLTGDHVLPRITPNVGLHPGEDAPVLADFLESLDRSATFDDHEALPAHEYRFRGLAARVSQLKTHHADRCAELLRLVTDLGSPTVWELTSGLTWSRPWVEVGRMKFAAAVETAAHIRYLIDGGELEWTGARPTSVRLAG